MSDLFGSDISESEGPHSPLDLTHRPLSPEPKSPGSPNSKGSLFGSDTEEPVEDGDNTKNIPAISPSGDALDDLFGSDSEAEGAAPQKDSYKDAPLFDRASDNEGRAGDDESDNDSIKGRGRKRNFDESDQEGSVNEENEEEYRKIQVRVMSARIAALPVPKSTEGRFVLARTPNIFQLDPTPYNEDLHEDIIAEEHEEARRSGYRSAVTPEIAMAVEGVISNTVRWRYKHDEASGKVQRESNARLVRWSDGSSSIVIGGRVPQMYNISSDPLVATPESSATEQYHYAAVHHQRELLMQSHARLTEQWSLLHAHQTPQTRHAVSLLLSRGRGSVSGSAGAERTAIPGKSSRTRFMISEEDPELSAKRAEKEEEQREKQRRRQEKLRERREARDKQRTGNSRNNDGIVYSDEDRDYGYESVGSIGGDAVDLGAERYPRPGGAMAGNHGAPARRFGVPQFGRRPRDSYIDDDDDGFVVDDDEELEIGPRDEFDEEEEEEEAATSRRLKTAKITDLSDNGSDRANDKHESRNTMSRRLMDSDDEDDGSM